ncbi:MAG: CPBP family intramembrane glutamic endopeptidase [Ginsengibacter sp.]
MIDKNSRNFSFSSQLGILLGLVGAGLVIGGIIIPIIIWVVMTGRPISSMATEIFNPKYYDAIMWIQVVSTLFMFFLPAYFTARICYRNPSRFLGLNTNVNYKQVLLVLVILILTFPLSGALAELTKMIPLPNSWQVYFMAKEADRAAQETALIKINSFPRYLFSMIIIALLPAVFEEVFFRGGLQNIFTRWFKGPWIAIIVTSIIFSAVHFSYYGFFVRAALGVALGLVFYYSGSIWLNILFHFLYNGVQVTALYVATMSQSKNTKDIEENFPIWMGLVAIVLIIIAFIKFRELSLAQQKKYTFPELDDPNDFHNWIARES